MRVIVAGGGDEAYFLVGALLDSQHEVSVICGDPSQAKRLSEAYGIEVVCGDPSSDDVLDDVSFARADIMVALTNSDAENLVVCQEARLVLGVEKTVCTVRNPRNVELFKELGVSLVFSETWRFARVIARATTMEDVSRILDGYDG